MLRRAYRLCRSRDFRSVYARSTSHSTGRLMLLTRVWRPGRTDRRGKGISPVRFGFSVSKKTAKKAHDRNKIKRRLREITRREIVPALLQAASCDTIVNVRTLALTASFDELRGDMKQMFRAARLIKIDEDS